MTKPTLGMTVTAGRFVLFAIVMAIVVGWVAAGNNQYASVARSFLKHLFRQMF